MFTLSAICFPEGIWITICQCIFWVLLLEWNYYFIFILHHKSWLNTWTWGMDRISKRLIHSYEFTLTLSLQRSHEQLSLQSALQFLCQFGEFGIRSPYISLIDNIFFFFFMTVVCLILYWHSKEKFCLDHSKK